MPHVTVYVPDEMHKEILNDTDINLSRLFQTAWLESKRKSSAFYLKRKIHKFRRRSGKYERLYNMVLSRLKRINAISQIGDDYGKKAPAVEGDSEK